jgi:hypothetical protein
MSNAITRIRSFSLVLGHNYRPELYYAEIVQGSEKLTLKLVKQ